MFTNTITNTGEIRETALMMKLRDLIHQFGWCSFCGEEYDYCAIREIAQKLKELGFDIQDHCFQLIVGGMVIYFRDNQLVVEGENEEECSWLFSLIVRNCPDGKDDISIGRFEATFVGVDPSFCVEEKEERQQQVNTRRHQKAKRGRKTRGKKEKKRNYRKENRKELW
jgi:hypothetical protein